MIFSLLLYLGRYTCIYKLIWKSRFLHALWFVYWLRLAKTRKGLFINLLRRNCTKLWLYQIVLFYCIWIFNSYFISYQFQVFKTHFLRRFMYTVIFHKYEMENIGDRQIFHKTFDTTLEPFSFKQTIHDMYLILDLITWSFRRL